MSLAVISPFVIQPRTAVGAVEKSGQRIGFSQAGGAACEVGTAAPYWLSPAVSAEPPPEPDLHVSAYPAPRTVTITVLGQV